MSFDGRSKSRLVSMKGKSAAVVERADILSAAARDRELRTVERARANAAIAIQSLFRGQLRRQQWRAAALGIWDSRMSDLNKVAGVLAMAGRGPLVPPLQLQHGLLRTLVFANEPLLEPLMTLRRTAALAKYITLGLLQPSNGDGSPSPLSLAALPPTILSFLVARLGVAAYSAFVALVDLPSAPPLTMEVGTIVACLRRATSGGAAQSFSAVARIAQLIVGHAASQQLTLLKTSARLIESTASTSSASAAVWQQSTQSSLLSSSAAEELLALSFELGCRSIGLMGGKVVPPAGVTEYVTPGDNTPTGGVLLLDPSFSSAAWGLLHSLSLESLRDAQGIAAKLSAAAGPAAAAAASTPSSYSPWLAVLLAIGAPRSSPAAMSSVVNTPTAHAALPSSSPMTVSASAFPAVLTASLNPSNWCVGMPGPLLSNPALAVWRLCSLVSLHCGVVCTDGNYEGARANNFNLSSDDGAGGPVAAAAAVLQGTQSGATMRAMSLAFVRAVSVLRDACPSCTITMPACVSDSSGTSANMSNSRSTSAGSSSSAPAMKTTSLAGQPITKTASSTACLDDFIHTPVRAVRMLLSGRKMSRAAAEAMRASSSSTSSSAAAASSLPISRQRGAAIADSSWANAFLRDDRGTDWQADDMMQLEVDDGEEEGADYISRADRSVDLALDMARVKSVGETLSKALSVLSSLAPAPSSSSLTISSTPATSSALPGPSSFHLTPGMNTAAASSSFHTAGTPLLPSAAPAALQRNLKRRRAPVVLTVERLDGELRRSVLSVLLLNSEVQSRLARLWSPELLLWLLRSSCSPLSAGRGDGSVAASTSTSTSSSSSSTGPSPAWPMDEERGSGTATAGGGVIDDFQHQAALPLPTEICVFIEYLLTALDTRERASAMLRTMFPRSWGAQASEPVASPSVELLELMIRGGWLLPIWTSLTSLQGASAASSSSSSNSSAASSAPPQQLQHSFAPPSSLSQQLSGGGGGSSGTPAVVTSTSTSSAAVLQSLFFRTLQHALLSSGIDDIEFHERGVPFTMPVTLAVVAYTRVALYRLCWADTLSSAPDAASLTGRPRRTLETMASAMAVYNNLFDRHNRRPFALSLTPEDWLWPALPANEVSVEVVLGIADDEVNDEAAAMVDAGTSSSSATTAAASAAGVATPSALGGGGSGDVDDSSASAAATAATSASHRPLGGVRYTGRRGVRQARIQLILTSVPHVLPFSTRVALFTALRERDRAVNTAVQQQQQQQHMLFVPPPQQQRVRITVRRDHLVQDAFEAFDSLARTGSTAGAQRRQYQQRLNELHGRQQQEVLDLQTRRQTQLERMRADAVRVQTARQAAVAQQQRDVQQILERLQQPPTEGPRTGGSVSSAGVTVLPIEASSASGAPANLLPASVSEAGRLLRHLDQHGHTLSPAHAGEGQAQASQMLQQLLRTQDEENAEFARLHSSIEEQIDESAQLDAEQSAYLTNLHAQTREGMMEGDESEEDEGEDDGEGLGFGDEEADGAYRMRRGAAAAAAAAGDTGHLFKHPFSIQFFNKEGLVEAGIDGGGLMKEFIDCVVRETFNPAAATTAASTSSSGSSSGGSSSGSKSNLPLFKETEGHMLYPNPAVGRAPLPPSLSSTATTSSSAARLQRLQQQQSDRAAQQQLHYYEFAGRLLGKAMYEGILVETRFAHFFLRKLLGKVRKFQWRRGSRTSSCESCWGRCAACLFLD